MKKTERKTGMILAIGGGKGGVGKSVLAIGLAAALARRGRSVVLADLDLGAANLHTYLGIHTKTATIADFILGRVPSLEDVAIPTGEENIRLISGAEFVPGMANPAHGAKMKLMRHLKALAADAVIIDLGAGVHFNTLDFFGISDRGIVITQPEPGAVMNAYGFIKAALFRRIQDVFRRHPAVSRMLETESTVAGDEERFSLDWFGRKLRETEPALLPLINEIGQAFTPALVINRAPAGRTHILVTNLIALCRDKLGVTLEHAGDLPDAQELSSHLLNVPRFLLRPEGEAYFDAVGRILGRTTGSGERAAAQPAAVPDLSDEDRDELLGLIDRLDDSVFTAGGRDLWKLRLFFKPADVFSFLVSRGVTHELFSPQ